MLGYRVYFDTNENCFKYDDVASEVISMPKDSTTSYMIDCKSAENAVNNLNQKINNVCHCKDCNNTFFMSDDERQWFDDRGLKTPVRCYRCRKKRNKSKN